MTRLKGLHMFRTEMLIIAITHFELQMVQSTDIKFWIKAHQNYTIQDVETIRKPTKHFKTPDTQEYVRKKLRTSLPPS